MVEKCPAHRKCSVNISCCYSIFSPILHYPCSACGIDYWQSAILLWASRGWRGRWACHFDLVCVYSQQKLIHTLDLSVAIGFRSHLGKTLDKRKKHSMSVSEFGTSPKWALTQMRSHRAWKFSEWSPLMIRWKLRSLHSKSKVVRNGPLKTPKFTPEKKKKNIWNISIPDSVTHKLVEKTLLIFAISCFHLRVVFPMFAPTGDLNCVGHFRTKRHPWQWDSHIHLPHFLLNYPMYCGLPSSAFS